MSLKNNHEQSTTSFDTKERIFKRAAFLFAEKGYKDVGMREIAEGIGIKAASIYNHFDSKERLLHNLYKFYIDNWEESVPDLDELLEMTRQGKVSQAIQTLNFNFGQDRLDIMEAIAIIAISRINSDDMSSKLLACHRHFKEDYIEFLNTLIEMDAIEPIDVETFTNVVFTYITGTTLTNSSPLKISKENKNAALNMIYSLIKIKPTK